MRIKGQRNLGVIQQWSNHTSPVNRTEEDKVDTGNVSSGSGKGSHAYKIRIDKEIVEFGNPNPTGRELLVKAGKVPAEQYAIYLKVKGGQPQRIGLGGKGRLDKGRCGEVP